MLQVPRAPFDELLPDLQRGLSGSGTFFVYTQTRLDMVTDPVSWLHARHSIFLSVQVVNVWWSPLLSLLYLSMCFSSFVSLYWPVAFSGMRCPCLKTCAPSHWASIFFWLSRSSVAWLGVGERPTAHPGPSVI